MSLIINLEISLDACLSLAGSLDIPMWCMVLFAMELLLCSLRALLHTLIMVAKPSVIEYLRLIIITNN